MSHSSHILMCPPDFYGIQYEINPWMSCQRPSDQRQAAAQWQALRDLLQQAGARVSCLAPVPSLPDLVFTANAALICRDQAVLSSFHYAERQRESPYDEQWLAEHGFRVYHLRSNAYFEGAGDALFCGDTLFAGYRIRSDVRASQEIGELLQCRVIPLELVLPHYYHLDTCFCPLDSATAIYYPRAFDEYGRKVLQESIPKLIPVGHTEARRFACNAVVVGHTVITNTGCPQLQRQLRARGFDVWETPLSEFVKAGGSAKCLTLRLDGEEAAAWKHVQQALCNP
jgi:N-dimethylarginine dimethylaminohydrolase